MFQQVRHQGDSLGGGHVGQTNQPAVWNLFEEDQLSEIRVDGDEDPFGPKRQLEEGNVSRV